MATWPATLPQVPLAGSWSEQTNNVLVGFQPDVGNPMVRRKSTVAHDVVSFSMAVTKTQKITLDTFYYDTTKEGAQTFDWLDPTTDPLALRTWRFVSPPSYSWGVGNNMMTVSVSLRREV